MQRRGRLALVGAVLGAVVLIAAGCSSDSGGGGAASGGASATTAAAGGGSDEIQLTAQGFKWSMTALDLKSGTAYKVEVTNKDGAEHNFTFKEANAAQDIEANEDATVDLTAPAAGSYKFFCKYHPTKMTGTVTVT